MLQLKAQEYASVAGIPRGVFTGTWVWRAGFVRRHALQFRARTLQGQKSPTDGEAAVRAFNTRMRAAMHRLGVDVAYNADQTPVVFEYVPRTTLNKLTPILILKGRPSKVAATQADNVALRHGFGKHLWKQIKSLQDKHSVQIYVNSTGWWNTSLTLIWLEYHFGGRQHPEQPVLLLLGDFSAHWTPEVRIRAHDLNIHLLDVPAGHTGVCQPTDVPWNRPPKQRLRQRWVS
ncbi:hypothetical protein PRIC2_013654 [Phytophthora ramorum]